MGHVDVYVAKSEQGDVTRVALTCYTTQRSNFNYVATRHAIVGGNFLEHPRKYRCEPVLCAEK
jgi:hypothetical protein